MRLYNDFIVNQIHGNNNLNINLVYDYICSVLILY